MCSSCSLPLTDVCCVQVYSQLPVQKLSGYSYEVEDMEPYPCFPFPMPEVEPEREADPEPDPEPEAAVDAEAPRRSKRYIYFGPPNRKNDVYSIFKVEHLSS